MWLKDDKLRCMFRQTAHEARPLRSHNVGANNPRQKYKIPSWTDDHITNIPMNVHTQRYKRLKDDRLRCMFLKRLMKHGFRKDIMFELIA